MYFTIFEIHSESLPDHQSVQHHEHTTQFYMTITPLLLYYCHHHFGFYIVIYFQKTVCICILSRSDPCPEINRLTIVVFRHLKELLLGNTCAEKWYTSNRQCGYLKLFHLQFFLIVIYLIYQIAYLIFSFSLTKKLEKWSILHLKYYTVCLPYAADFSSVVITWTSHVTGEQLLVYC